MITTASALSKLSAIPLVNRLLTRNGAGSVPRAAALEDPEPDEADEPTTSAGYPDALNTEPENAPG